MRTKNRHGDHAVTVIAFAATAKAFEGLLKNEDIYVRSPQVAVDLDVRWARHCGVVCSERGYVDCLAVAGPDGLGNWSAVDLQGRVFQVIDQPETKVAS